MSANEVTEATARTRNHPPPFRCTARQGRGATWIHVRGELDIASAPTLEIELDRCASARLTVLDLRDVTFLETTGVHTILAASNAAARAGRRFLLIRAHGTLTDIFTLTQVADQLEIVDLQRSAPASQVLHRPAYKPLMEGTDDIA